MVLPRHKLRGLSVLNVALVAIVLAIAVSAYLLFFKSDSEAAGTTRPSTTVSRGDVTAVHEARVRNDCADETLFRVRLRILRETLLNLRVQPLRIAFVKRSCDRRLPHDHPGHLGKLGE